jgi:hypothetical protein
LLGQVKVFDGQGNLIRIIQPVQDYEITTMRKAASHPCPICKTETTRPIYCRKECAEKQKKIFNKKKSLAATAARTPPKEHPCCICLKLTIRPKYCSNDCSVMAIRMKGRVGGWLENPSRRENK